MIIPKALKGKPFRRLQREWNQRRYVYPVRNVLVIGQQKSGSTWLERMLCAAPGYMRWKPRGIRYGVADLDLAQLVPAPAGYTVTKVHTPPTPENLRVVRATERPYAVLTRDLRDICVSWSHYVRVTPAHPRHRELKDVPVPGVMAWFIEHRLDDYIEWQLGWLRELGSEAGRPGILVRYEELLADTPGQFDRILDHFGIDLVPEVRASIVEAQRFSRVTGRQPGQEDAKSFNRKGIAGDWRNHFTPEHREAFERVARGRLVETGYELGEAWLVRAGTPPGG